MGATRRTLVFLSVLGVHVLILLLFTLQRPSIESDLPVIEVEILIGAETVSPSPAPVPVPQVVQPQLLPPPIPVLVLPNVPNVEVLPEPVADPQVQEAQPDAPANSPGEAPLQVQRIDYIRQPSAPYPPGARRRRETGTVLLVVLVGADGLAKDATLYRSSGHTELDAAAVKAVFSAVFRPETENGVPRAVRVVVPIDFTLTEQPTR